MTNAVPFTRRTVTALTIGLLASLLALPAAALAGEPWSGVVTWVADGDTLRVKPASGGAPVSVRIRDIDAPEICQSGGAASREALNGRVRGRAVKVSGKARDAYGRLVAGVTVDDQDVGQWMVLQGQAWATGRRPGTGLYAVQQAQAQAARRGIFGLNQGAGAPVSPAVFRKQHKSCYR